MHPFTATNCQSMEEAKRVIADLEQQHVPRENIRVKIYDRSGDEVLLREEARYLHRGTLAGGIIGCAIGLLVGAAISYLVTGGVDPAVTITIVALVFAGSMGLTTGAIAGSVINAANSEEDAWEQAALTPGTTLRVTVEGESPPSHTDSKR